MARIRNIKPEFFTSETVSALPLRARLTWIGLWTQADNYGRARDNVKLVKAAVWPLDDGVGLDAIEDDLAVLAQHHLIVRYEVEGKRYLEIANWRTHQYGSCKGEPKYPGPDQGVQKSLDESKPDQDSSTSDQDEHETGTEKSSGIQGLRVRDHIHAQDFEEFWKTYPRKDSKQAARKAFNKAAKAHGSGKLIEEIERWSGLWQSAGIEKRFIPHAATWLNQERWEDESPSPRLRAVSGGNPEDWSDAPRMPWWEQ